MNEKKTESIIDKSQNSKEYSVIAAVIKYALPFEYAFLTYSNIGIIMM